MSDPRWTLALFALITLLVGCDEIAPRPKTAHESFLFALDGCTRSCRYPAGNAITNFYGCLRACGDNYVRDRALLEPAAPAHSNGKVLWLVQQADGVDVLRVEQSDDLSTWTITIAADPPVVYDCVFEGYRLARPCEMRSALVCEVSRE